MVHISTDQLFRGEKSPYTESDRPAPLNEYGRSKLLAEEWVLEACPQALIIRTNFFGWGYAGRQSFSDWIIYSLRAGKSIPMFDDVYFTPILADDLARAVHELIERGASGIYNVVGEQRLSKYQFGLSVARHFALPEELIRCELVRNAKLRAQRPLDMSLDNGKVRQALGRKLGGVNDFLGDLLEQEHQGRREELFGAVSA